MSSTKRTIVVAVVYAVCTTLGLTTALEMPMVQSKSTSLTYVKDVAPIIKMYCRPCHDAENENPSDLSLDDYETMMKGGRHGVPVVAGKPKESSLYFKLQPNPSFGKEMPRGRKKITEEAVRVIHDWIEQGAKKE